MNSDTTDRLVIDVAQPNERLAALGLVFAQYSEGPLVAARAETLLWELVDRTMEQSRHGKLSLDHLLVARRGGRVTGAGWLQLMAGRVGMIWPAQLANGEQTSTAAGIMAQLDQRAGALCLRLLQAFVFSHDEHSTQQLIAAGYESQSQMLIYASDCQQPVRDMAVEPLEFEPYETNQRPRLEQLIEETYSQSLDCPELNGVCDISDVVDGHQAAGQFDSRHWFFVRRDGRDIGCLLLADHPRDDQFELVYMGLVPSARKNGCGKAIARHAQRLTHRAGRGKLILAVDARNTPAIGMYEAAAFECRDSRRVFVKILGQLAGASHRAADE